MMKPDFTGKVVLITGASSGIGATTAVILSNLGAKLALTGSHNDHLQQTYEMCNHTAESFCVVADLTKDADVESIVKKTIDHYGQLDILINNAGIIEKGTIENTTLAQYDRMMNTNVRALYYLTMLAVPHLIKTKGNIVNVSSINAIRPFRAMLAYSMSKCAVDHFTRCVAVELGPMGVRVNCVNPGFILTDLQKRGGVNEMQYVEFLERTASTHCLGRPGKPYEVASAIIFLASEWASNVTGVSLPTDGGRHASNI